MLSPVRLRQCEIKNETAVTAAHDTDMTSVEKHGVLYYRKTEPGASGLTRTPLVDTIKAFEKPRQMLLGNSRAVIGNRNADKVTAVIDSYHLNLAAARIVDGIGDKITEYRVDETGVALYLYILIYADINRNTFVGGGRSKFVTYSSDSLFEIERLESYVRRAILETCDLRDIVKQTAQTLTAVCTTAYKIITALRAERRMCCQCFETDLHSCHRRLELMIDIVGQTAFHIDSLLFFPHRRLMLAVSVGHSLLQPRI